MFLITHHILLSNNMLHLYFFAFVFLLVVCVAINYCMALTTLYVNAVHTNNSSSVININKQIKESDTANLGV